MDFAVLFLLISNLMIILVLSVCGYTIAADAFQNHTKDSTLYYYGCEKDAEMIHCDQLHNNLQSYGLTSKSSTLYHATDIPIFVNGKEDQALEMHANYLESVVFPNTTTVEPKKFSISFWIKGIPPPKNTESPGLGYIISQFNDDRTSGWSFSASDMNNVTTESLRFDVFNEKGNTFSSPDIPIYKNDNTFTHIVGTFDGSTIRVFKDGLFFGETKFNGIYRNAVGVPIRLGVAADTPMSYFWSGNIDSLQIYEKPLSPNEIEQISGSNSVSSNASNSLIGYWKFNGNLDDDSGNCYHGQENTLISSMVFTPDGRLFFSEKDTGNIRIMKDGKVNTRPFATISNVYKDWEQGLLGLAIDPKFEQNHFIYLYYTTLDNETGSPFNRVMRFTDEGNKATNRTIILDRIPASHGYHSGGALAFRSDDKLYITVGDATQNIQCGNLPNSKGFPCAAQDPSSLLGKVLRINRDGSIPKDNPYPNSPVYNIGHINMYGIAFDKGGFGLVSENGDVLYDEINTVKKGGNYGAPTLQRINSNPENSSNSIKPLRTYYIARCLTQMIYYNGDKVPILKDKFLVGNLRGNIINGYIYALQVDKVRNQVVSENVISLYHFPNNEAITLAESPSGDIYYSGYTINKLDSVNVTSKQPTSFPIEMNYSSTILNIRNVQIFPSENKLYIDVNVKEHNGKFLTPTLQVKVPKEVLTRIFAVSSSIEKQGKFLGANQYEKMNFTTSDSGIANNTDVIIPFTQTGVYRLSIVGNSS